MVEFHRSAVQHGESGQLLNDQLIVPASIQIKEPFKLPRAATAASEGADECAFVSEAEQLRCALVRDDESTRLQEHAGANIE
jgi:hypothetical protein